MRVLLLLAWFVGSAPGPPSIAPSSPARSALVSTGPEAIELDSRVWCIQHGRNGDLWLGTNGDGVYRYDGQRLTHYARADGLSGLQVRDIQEDREGHVLVSTTDGVFRFDGRNWTELEVEAAPSGTGWRLDPDDVWIVVEPGVGGPCRYDGERLYRLELSKSPAEDAHRAKYPDSSFPPAGVYSIYEDRRGHLWFGTAGAGLCRYDGQTLSWLYEERLTTTATGGAFGIRSIYEDPSGDFWICNTRQRFAFSPETSLDGEYHLLAYEKKAGLPDARSDTGENFTYCPSITADDAGSLWLACGSDGVWKYDGEGVTKYDVGDGAYALRIHADGEGGLWVGTLEHGAYTFDGERFERFEPHGTKE